MGRWESEHSQGDSGPAGLASLRPAPLAGVGRDRLAGGAGPSKVPEDTGGGVGRGPESDRGGEVGEGRPCAAQPGCLTSGLWPCSLAGLGALPLAPLLERDCTKAPEPVSLGNSAYTWSLHVTTAQAGVEAANVGLTLLHQLSPDSEATYILILCRALCISPLTARVWIFVFGNAI